MTTASDAARRNDTPFTNHVEFEQRLSTYTRSPPEQLEELLAWSEEDVRREARAVAQVLKRFAQAVVRSLDEEEEANRFLDRLDLRTITRDHDWRAIFVAIQSSDIEGVVEYKRTAMIKYLQYLSFRKRLLDYVHARKAGLAQTDELPSPALADPASDDEMLDETISVITAGFAKMPMGETIIVSLAEDDVLEVVLGRNLFELVGGPHPYLVDESGVTCFVKRGRNIIGRHPECDIAVDGNFSFVSRAHLILEWDGNNSYTLMDLSSRGTWMRDDLLADALRPMIRDVA